MKSFRVLVLPGGTEIGLEIHRALRYCKEVELFSAGIDVPNHAPYVFQRHFVVPAIHQPEWIPALNRLLEQQAIDYIYPAYDDVLMALARHAPELRARVVTSPLETCRITRSKSLTYEHLRDVLPTPRQYRAIADVPGYPVFVKPDAGQGSQRARAVPDRAELESALAHDDSLLILEHLPGPEYTIDCFSDRERGLLFCGGRSRVRTRSGISVTSEPVEDARFRARAEAIASRLTFHGAWFFQLKEDAHGELRLLEVAPRIAGAMALHRVMGVNFPLLSLYEQERIPVSILINPAPVRLDRALVNRYEARLDYQEVYVDLDDTLIFKGRVNDELVRFLYQAFNAGKRLVVLTRHAGDPQDTLRRHRLAGLFDEVIHLQHGEPKAGAIRTASAILIDDSFRERQEVQRATGISTFDGSMLELLLSERG